MHQDQLAPLYEQLMELNSRVGSLEASAEAQGQCLERVRDDVEEVKTLVYALKAGLANKRRPISLGAGGGALAAAVVEVVKYAFGPRF